MPTLFTGAIDGALNANNAFIVRKFSSATKRWRIVTAVTTAERDAISNVPNGLTIYNTTTARTEVKEAGGWVALGGSTPALPASSPAFSPAAGTFVAGQSLTITCATPGAVIYYTTNGTTPTSASFVYSGPLTVSASQTIRAIAIAPGYADSAIITAAYSITGWRFDTTTYSLDRTDTTMDATT